MRQPACDLLAALRAENVIDDVHLSAEDTVLKVFGSNEDALDEVESEVKRSSAWHRFQDVVTVVRIRVDGY